ncbi:GAF and ANTAR domain-containing protein [Actinoplanes sp. N902-109]|uniref:GAF and ANTAR domain-containing protein n=1 Tax=Actinoplanes sp. (strain N902-109) TaxID=649831 RepID=UPI00032951FB|nr:GAF and ANTAR domain-containing protein [Actinoplanes sp. N902-109]AGL18914.1 ANTAR domain-containing protein [Actinoplanes sp. N902-109]
MDPTAAFRELGQIKLGETDLKGVLDRIARLAKQTVPGADEVSVTLIPERGPYTISWTGQPALEVDEQQYRDGSGPCLEAAMGKATLAIHEVAGETRWPAWAEHAWSRGVRSSASVGMPIHDNVSGGLNVYSRAVDAFDDESLTLLETFAGYAAVALANAHLYDTTTTLAQHMQAAMESRAVIEQAKGIIMGERRCSPDEAFTILAKLSQDSNRKLRDVAVALVNRAQRP